MKKYKKPSKSTKKCIEMGGTFTPSSRDYTPKPRRSYYNRDGEKTNPKLTLFSKRLW